eukprot:TRINITY_DN77484_c0_g1_i1.p1 TRINITY_DN77484_c0_g1~~TRINITY_DN77484_c0_g1_i1.p1  ORF type:complete len:600 (+),score=107.81 TRINITY_DN77484_c0_g1_i1:26-1801(+)
MLARALLLHISVLQAAATPFQVFYFDLAEATVKQNLTYEEQALAFAFQGIVNDAAGKQPTLFFNAGPLDFDWPRADKQWRGYLEAEGMVAFRNVSSTLCSLIAEADPSKRVRGTVAYADVPDALQVGDGYSLAIALTLAGQQSLLPVTTSTLNRHACLRDLPLAVDLRNNPRLKNRSSAWDWAIEMLLPQASKHTIFNLNRFRQPFDPDFILHDPQSNATITTIDYAVQQRAFVLDMETHLPPGRGGADDDALIERVFSKLEPLFSAYGWSYEYSWTNLTSHAGGAVFCSFATPGLSFWSTLPVDVTGSRRARSLPRNDRGLRLDRSKRYVIFQTNEGDTPRIVDSFFGSAWASPERGNLPVAWAINPLLAEQFPALFDYYAKTATANDSFIAGVGGAGYVFLNQLSQSHFHAYAKRAGRILQDYGPDVVDSYGFASFDLLANYSRFAAEGGKAPSAYVSQPTNWDFTFLSSLQCPRLNNWQRDGTPVVCTPDNDPWLFYYADGLNKTCPSCDLAERIKKHAEKYEPPVFVNTYGGLHWTANAQEPLKEFWTLLQDTMSKLGDEYVVIGAQEMARLARQLHETAPFEQVMI